MVEPAGRDFDARQQILGSITQPIAGAQHQVLEGLLQLHFDVGHDQLGLLEALPARPIEQRLGQDQIPGAASAAVRDAQAVGGAAFVIQAAGFARQARIRSCALAFAAQAKVSNAATRPIRMVQNLNWDTVVPRSGLMTVSNSETVSKLAAVVRVMR